MEVKHFKKTDTKTWELFVSQNNKGTLFHTRRFLNYHPEGRFKDHSLMFFEKGKMVALFPAAEITNHNRKILVSHPGASFGSFVTSENISFRNTMELVKTLKSYASEHDFNGVRTTLPPAIYRYQPSNYLDFSLLKNGFTYYRREISSILLLEKSIDKTLARFRPSHRQAVRKAQRYGIQIRESDDFANFYRMLKKNLKIRHGVEPTHTLEELCLLNDLFPDQVVLHSAILDNKMIAGVVNFIVNPKIILAFYISHDEHFQESRPLNLLFSSIFEWAIQKGIHAFDFGIFTVKEEPNFGLARFKENFGASGIFRDTLELYLTQ